MGFFSRIFKKEEEIESYAVTTGEFFSWYDTFSREVLDNIKKEFEKKRISIKTAIMQSHQKVIELEDILRMAKLISKNHTKNMVDMGCKVVLHVDGKKEEFTLVGEWEADPKEKKISHESPLGKALMGKKVGEKVEVEAPAGKVLYKILEIE